MFTYAELVQAVYDYLQQKNDAGNVRLTPTMVQAAVLLGYVQFAKDTRCFKGTTVLSVTSGTPTFSYPVDMFRLRRVRYSAGAYDLEYVSERELDAHNPSWRTQSGTPRYWTEYDARNFLVSPIPSFTALAAMNGTLATGSAVVTVITDTSSVKAGMAVSGTGVPAGCTVFTVDSTTQVTLSAVATATGVESLTFSPALTVEGFLVPYGTDDSGATAYGVPFPDEDSDTLALPDQVALAPAHWAVAQLGSRYLSDRETADKVVSAALTDYKRLLAEYNITR